MLDAVHSALKYSCLTGKLLCLIFLRERNIYVTLFANFGTNQLILKTWEQKKTIDSGTNPPEVEKIIDLIKDYALGYKLPGAGGGGYLYIVAKDPEAAVRIRRILTENPPNEKARFVEMTLSDKGFQVSRS